MLPCPSLAVPPEVQLPGSQPPETKPAAQPDLVPLLEHDDCVGCHTGDGTPTNDLHAITHNWQGSMMANASRDPLMWAQLAIVQQDLAGTPVAGATDTCLRCHLPKGWIIGRSVPANGSLMQDDDADGVNCHVCHRLTDPSDEMRPGQLEQLFGEQYGEFVANDGAAQPEGFYGNAMYVLYQMREGGGATTIPSLIARLGPYVLGSTAVPDAAARPPHDAAQSFFHREPELCGTCHDVSNPVVGDLAPSHGVQKVGLNPVPNFDGTVFPQPAQRATISGKAGFTNPPYAYGAEQRTYSEHVASGFATTLVSEFDTVLPTDLRVDGGALQIARALAMLAGNGGDYKDGTPRKFTCQTCHLPPVVARGGNNVDDHERTDLPTHDLTGANYWGTQAVAYLDGANKRIIGSALSAGQIQALSDGEARARSSLQTAASLTAEAGAAELTNTIRVTNLTGHKLWTGYPDGRRMWLNVRWLDDQQNLVHEDCAYGSITVQLDVDGDLMSPDQVDSLVDLDCPDTRVWRVESGISQPWAERLIAAVDSPPDDGLGADPTLPLSFDRLTGAANLTLGDLAANPDPDAHAETNHLILNDVTIFDNRIPPWNLDYSDALARNALPIPETLFTTQGQTPAAGDKYDHFDGVPIAPPAGMPSITSAEVRLYYQPVSWEYIEFLWLANRGDTASGGDDFLQDTGDDLLEAWLATGMAAPQEMALLVVPEPSGPLAQALALGVLGLLRLHRNRYGSPRLRPGRGRP